MKKIVKIAIYMMLALSLTLTISAANHVEWIDVQATIRDDGSMYIVQTWQGDFNKGTENYIPMLASDYMSISNLTVSDINGTYETLDKWDIDASFEEKANKCGINYTKDGYEICFGISQYGNNRYALEYVLDQVVGAYDDYDGVNFRFVNDQMNTTPTDVKVQIYLQDGTPITDEMADIWSFGYNGKVEFSNGGILAYTESPIKSNNHVTVMFALEKGVLNPTRVEKGSFEKVKDRAFDGSDYDNKNKLDWTEWLYIIAMLIVAFSPFIALIFITIRKICDFFAKKKFEANTDYFRNIPNYENINVTYRLGKGFKYCKEDGIISATIIKLMKVGAIEPITEESVGWFGKTKKTVNLKINQFNDDNSTPEDEYLFSLFKRVCGEDGVLQAEELEEYIKKHDTVMRSFIDNATRNGMYVLKENNCIKKNSISRIKHLTDEGKTQLKELIGFKKYLKDFTLINERSAQEVVIWKDLLVYATLFDMTDEVVAQLREFYPDIVVELDQMVRTTTVAHSYSHIMYTRMITQERRRAQAARSSGSGGRSSFGGGGGSSGGGSGGGSR